MTDFPRVFAAPRVPYVLALSLAVASLSFCPSCALSSRARDGGGEELASYPGRPPVTRLFDYAGFRDSANWGLLNGHDPSVLRDGGEGLWYAYSTDAQRGMLAEPGCQIRRSRDLVSWEFVGRAFRDVPAEAAEWARPAGLWAPDCVKVDGEFRLYYSASSFGKQRSAIGLAVASRPEGPFMPRGLVLKSDEGDPVNAIDPCVVLDRKSGEQWMAYGSFWNGIRMLRLDSATGLVAPDQDCFGIPIARRHESVRGAVEGAHISYNELTGFYYLFVSYGSLFSDYNVRVARSASVTGPYLDRDGHAMTDVSSPPDSVGFRITTGYRFGDRQGWMALGHNSAFEREGEWFIAHHARPEGGTSWPYLQIRRLFWTADGWPVASPHPYSFGFRRRALV